MSKLFKRSKLLLSKAKNFLIASFALGIATIPFGSQFAYADGGFSGSGDTITSAGKSAVTKIIKGVGAFFVFIAVITGAIQIIFYRNNEQKRTGAMTGLGWVFVGALIMVLGTVITGFFWSSIGGVRE